MVADVAVCAVVAVAVQGRSEAVGEEVVQGKAEKRTRGFAYGVGRYF
jgi:hypothetical protein